MAREAPKISPDGAEETSENKRDQRDLKARQLVPKIAKQDRHGGDGDHRAGVIGDVIDVEIRPLFPVGFQARPEGGGDRRVGAAGGDGGVILAAGDVHGSQLCYFWVVYAFRWRMQRCGVGRWGVIASFNAIQYFP